MKTRLFFLAFLVLIVSVSCQRAPHGAVGVLGKHGMVVSAHPEASAIGLQILKKGGNAVDAACAVGFALSVCYPAAGNIGGGGFMVIRTSRGEVNTLNYREKAPLASSRDMYLDDRSNVIPGASTNTILATGVPGSVAGLAEAHERYGKLNWNDLVQPAIHLAQKGFPLTAHQAAYLNSLKKVFIKRNNATPIPFVKDGKWQKGDTLRQPDLAHTLELIRDYKKDGFYKGVTAEKIVSFIQNNGGLLTMQDLSDYQVQWLKPISGTYRNYTFYSMPPPSSGGIALYQLLKMAEPYPLKDSGWNQKATVHYLAEVEKRVFADRTRFLGDPDFIDIPVDKLLDPEYITRRIKEIPLDRASKPDEIEAGKFTYTEHTETTHYSITDTWGNAVAVTTTLNGGYGNKMVVTGAGFFLNNEMDDFSVKPGVPNMYGLIGGEANAIAPGKRMLSSMTPTILTKNEKLFMVVGSPGGSTIITSVFQTILDVVDYGMTMQEAVSAPRFHHQWLPDYIRAEPEAFDSTTVSALQLMGYSLKIRGTIGRVDAIRVWPDGTYEGGADPRGDDSAKGY